MGLSKKMKSNMIKGTTRKKRIPRSRRMKNVIKMKKKKVLLPEYLLKKAQKISQDKTLDNLEKAIKIYDIDDELNFCYLKNVGKIDDKNYKYVYTLSFDNRKKIMEQYRLKAKVLTKESKMIFNEFVNFLINNYKPTNKSSKKKLKTYDLKNFDKFIIQIYEGTEELKYYYFMSIIFSWLKKDPDKAITCLRYFKSFFEEKDNIEKIEKVCYIIFRIDLLFLDSGPSNYMNSLLNTKLLVEQDIKSKMMGLALIKDEIKENLDNIQITDNTVLTLKKKKYKFKPIDYYIYPFTSEKIDYINNIKNKTWVTYDYCLKNKFNYFENNIKRNAFLRFFKKILSSRVMKEYFSKLIISENYEFPLNNRKLVNFLWEKIIFTEIDTNYGMTNREGFGIFINRTKVKINGLEYGICIITISHEFITHSLGSLINSNDGIQAGTLTPIKSFINSKDNTSTKKIVDSGDKFEYFLFGNRVSILTIGGNHFIFNINNWDLSLKEFRAGFIKNNKVKSSTVLKNELQVLMENDADIKILFNNFSYDNITNKKDSQSTPARRSNENVQSKEFVA